MTLRRILIVLAILSLGGAAFVVYNSTRSQTAAAATTGGAQVATVTRGNLIATVNSAGPIAARRQLNVTFGTAGTVSRVFVQLGDKVKQGQVLAELDTTDLQVTLANATSSFNAAQARYEQAKAGPTDSDVAAARANVENAQANYDIAVRKAGLNDAQVAVARSSVDKSRFSLQKAQNDYDQAVLNRVTDLTSVSVALQQAKIDYSNAVTNFNLTVIGINDSAVRSALSTVVSARASLDKLLSSPTPQDLAIAQSSFDQSRVAFQQAQYHLRDAQLVAPFDGTVTQLNIDNFFQVGASTAAVQISDLNTLQVTVNMAEVDISKVKQGQTVNITMDALPDRTALTGTVDQVALVGVTTQGVVNYPVVITLKGVDPAVIKTGMTANVGIIVDQRENVLLVPNRAIRTVGRTRQVQVQSAVGLPVPTTVTIGLQNDTNAEVLSGLREGDVVVIASTTTRPTTGGFGGAPGGGPVFVGR
ncbi:MAG: efflux RND transporter periplasmic adaptor subunit [Chloroflexi bacterium]|nr:efflux RND transporter periplasmic adaptor subunit [Chloroflexota bacterium]